MSEAAEKLRTELANLTIDDRVELAHFLINSLDRGSDTGAEEAWDAELARRVEEVNTGRATGEPAEKVFSELRQKHS